MDNGSTIKVKSIEYKIKNSKTRISTQNIKNKADELLFFYEILNRRCKEFKELFYN